MTILSSLEGICGNDFERILVNSQTFINLYDYLFSFTCQIKNI